MERIRSLSFADFGTAGFVACFLRGLPGVTEYAGRSASVRSTGLSASQRACAAMRQTSARLIPGYLRALPIGLIVPCTFILCNRTFLLTTGCIALYY